MNMMKKKILCLLITLFAAWGLQVYAKTPVIMPIISYLLTDSDNNSNNSSVVYKVEAYNAVETPDTLLSTLYYDFNPDSRVMQQRKVLAGENPAYITTDIANSQLSENGLLLSIKMWTSNRGIEPNPDQNQYPCIIHNTNYTYTGEIPVTGTSFTNYYSTPCVHGTEPGDPVRSTSFEQEYTVLDDRMFSMRTRSYEESTLLGTVTNRFFYNSQGFIKRISSVYENSSVTDNTTFAYNPGNGFLEAVRFNNQLILTQEWLEDGRFKMIIPPRDIGGGVIIPGETILSVLHTRTGRCIVDYLGQVISPLQLYSPQTVALIDSFYGCY